jgi:hypothetical protein
MGYTFVHQNKVINVKEGNVVEYLYIMKELLRKRMKLF